MARKRSGTWLTVAVLLALLGMACVILYIGLTPPEGEQGTPMSAGGYVAMALGVVVTLGLGIGLMSLIFYSNRSGRD
jgi:hypothetical protein